MLACARIGAIHSVVFGGFASNELASRIDDSKAKVLVQLHVVLNLEEQLNTNL
jgi:acyl-coenzyme A synthetase/AMP-(fatty) acid ligase